MKRILEKYLKIYSHESPSFLWIASIFFVIFFVTAIFRTYVDASFLKRYGPQYIPWMLVINALLTFVILGVVDRLARKFRDHYLLSGFLLIYAASSAILFVMVKAGFTIVYPILYQLLYLLDSILLVYLWNIAGDLFDTRQGKRIFPMITAAQVLGTTLGSFSTKPLTLAIGEDPTLLVFGAVCLGTALFLAPTGTRIMGKFTPKRGPGAAAATTVKLTDVPRIVAEYPIIRYLIVTGLIPNLLLPIFFYQFSVIANKTFTTEASLISFLSIFRGTTTMLTFVLLMFMGRLYSRVGLTNASLFHPINFTLIFASLAAFFNIYVASYGQFTVILIQRAIAGPVNKVLYNIVPPDLIAWSRSFIRGSVLKVGMLIGSVSMILLKPVLDVRYFSLFAIVFAVYWVIETLLFRKRYKRILKQVIVEQQIDFDQIESVRAFDSGGAAMEYGPVAVEDREEVPASTITRDVPAMDPDVALKLLNDENPGTRAEAAASFIGQEDIRAVGKLVKLLGDTDDDVRQSVIEALVTYGKRILPFLEVSLIDATPRVKHGILEVIRLSGLKEFELVPFVGKELIQAYANLIALKAIERAKELKDDTLSVGMLKQHLGEVNEEILSLIFYALWVSHADMRLMYAALKSESASIAVEMVENSLDRAMSPYLIPLIEDVPLDEKIEKGRSLLPLIRTEDLDRIFNIMSNSGDPVLRMLTLYVIGDQVPEKQFIPTIEDRLNDEHPSVREMAVYALKRTLNEDAHMPDIANRIKTLKGFSIFEGMGIRELHAIASVVTLESFKTGDVMIREGEENSSIYLVVNGKITIVVGYETADQKEKVTIGEGAFLGELSLFTRMTPNATCIAAEETQAYVIRHHQFQEIMRVYPQIGINLCAFFTMKLRQVSY
jgi:Cyclic nucleotide-binding domain/HEAT repeats/HEAT repeat